MKQIAELIDGRDLVHADMRENVRDVAQRMAEKNIGAVAVLDAGQLVGVFSERDVMSRVVAQGLDPEGTPVGMVMTKEIIVADPQENVNDALQKMSSIGCRHLPVVDKGNLVGMISLRDLLRVDGEENRRRASFLSELVTYSPDYES